MKEPGYCRSNFLGLTNVSLMAKPRSRRGPSGSRKAGALRARWGPRLPVTPFFSHN